VTSKALSFLLFDEEMDADGCSISSLSIKHEHNE